MNGLYIELVLGAIVILGAAYLERRRAMLEAENTKLRDQILEKDGDEKIEKLQAKLSADKLSGAAAEDAFRTFRKSHPDSFPPDSKK